MPYCPMRRGASIFCSRINRFGRMPIGSLRGASAIAVQYPNAESLTLGRQRRNLHTAWRDLTGEHMHAAMVGLLILSTLALQPAYGRGYHCIAHVDGAPSVSLAPVARLHRNGCKTRMSNGFPMPDPACTPGAINPHVTVAVLKSRSFNTHCTRDQATTSREKSRAYGYYGIPHPRDNTGRDQTCELDHLVSLELGGADTLDNIWPQCGPDDVALRQRYFKQKDKVENYLARQVEKGKMSLEEAQRGVASDWTQYLEAANAASRRSKHR